MIYDEPVIPEIRETAGDPWRALAAAVAERGIDDLTCRHRELRTSAARFVEGEGFPLLLELAGVQIGADACRAALRASGRLPPS
jgi:hypothetical protein